MLFGDLPDAGGIASGEGADNSRCLVCHMNFEVEELAQVHAEAGIGCEDCHGSSDAHCSDEDNVTPPDKIYGPADVNPSCRECHKDLAGSPPSAKAHKKILAGGSSTRCTDCHGKHRLPVRTRRWDPKTGKLIKDDKVRMIRAR